MKTISIIIPMYNSFHRMEKNLRVLSCQKGCKFQIILIDDLSTDDSFARATDFAAACEMDVVVLKNEKNRGPGVSRNRGLSYAVGDYVTFVDSDDSFSEDFSERVVPLLEKGWDCVLFDYERVDENGEHLSFGKTVIGNVPSGELDPRTALVYVTGTPWGKIYRREILVENGVCFAELYRNEDMPFTKHAVAMCKTLYYTHAALYCYVQLPSSLMHTNKLLDEGNAQKAFAFLRERLDGKGFEEELKILELREVLNNTVLIRVAKKQKKKEIRQYIRRHYTKEHLNNKYFRRQKLYVKILSCCAYYKLFLPLSFLWWCKNWKKNH